MHKADTAKIAKLFRSLFESRFNGVTVSDVRVERDMDADDEEILRVTVIFDADRDSLSPDETRGLIRTIRPKLASIGEEAFPILSFVKTSEAGGLGAAA